MNNFKIGDIVIRTQNMPCAYASQVGNEPTEVVSISGCGRYVRVNRIDNEYPGGYHVEWFVPYVFPGDTLPPAPESGVYYSHNNNRRLTVLLEEGLPEDVIAVGTDTPFIKVRLTAETALVLAHDLNRMANEIKRKEKQNG